MFINSSNHVSPLIQRYADTGEGGGGGGDKEMFVISRNRLVTPVEMVGADKINKTTRLVILYCKLSGPAMLTYVRNSNVFAQISI